jgi:hypothetical protein
VRYVQRSRQALWGEKPDKRRKSGLAYREERGFKYNLELLKNVSNH